MYAVLLVLSPSGLCAVCSARSRIFDAAQNPSTEVIHYTALQISLLPDNTFSALSQTVQIRNNPCTSCAILLNVIFTATNVERQHETEISIEQYQSSTLLYILGKYRVIIREFYKFENLF